MRLREGQGGQAQPLPLPSLPKGAVSLENSPALPSPPPSLAQSQALQQRGEWEGR